MNNKISAAILVVSFGTTHLDTLERCIAATEKAIAERFPEYPVYRAFTSGIVMRRLKEKYDFQVDSVQQALSRIEQDGFTRVVIQPTLLLRGIEYEKMERLAKTCSKLQVAFGKPLIQDETDCAAIAKILKDENPLVDKEALILMGHGTEHEANRVYCALQEEFDRLGYPAVIGTVEGTPDFSDAANAVKALGIAKAKLLPLMFVAGDHAKNDMAGEEEDSLLSMVQAVGVSAEPVIRGLGESPAVQKLYALRAETALSEVLA